MEQKTLKTYVEKKKITMEKLSECTGVSLAQLHLIAKNPEYNVTADTIKRIMRGTKVHFGKALEPSEYLAGWDIKK